MPKDYELTDEEIIRDCDAPACVLYKTPQEGHLIASREVAHAAQKKLFKWQSELCTEHTTIIIVDGNVRNTRRKECPHCWKSLSKDFGVSL